MIPSAILMLLRKKFRVRRLLSAGKLTYVGIVFISSVFINGALFYVAENVLGGDKAVTLWRGFYWALVTMATVGYGDIVPKTTPGYIVTVETVVLGIAVFTMLVSSLAEEFMNRSIRKSMGLGKLKHVKTLVIGDSETCREVISELKVNIGLEEVGWLMPEPPKNPPKELTFVSGDPADEDTLRRANITKVSKVVLCLGDDSKALHTALMIRKLNSKAQIISSASNRKSSELLKEAGVNYVVPITLMGRVLASATFEPAVAEFINEVSTARGVADLIELRISKKHESFSIKDFVEDIPKDLVRASRIKVLAVRRKGDLFIAPNDNFILKEGDEVVLLKAV